MAFVLILTKLLIQGIQNKKIKVELIRVTQELAILKNLLDQKEKLASDKNDGFVKFISDSRDWAFEYIENVQQSIQKVLHDTEHTIKYHREFTSMEIEPYKTQLDTLSNAIDELKQLLPKEEFIQ
jgi:hypothetical protein